MFSRWCATQIDEHGVMKDGMFGICDVGCEVQEAENGKKNRFLSLELSMGILLNNHDILYLRKCKDLYLYFYLLLYVAKFSYMLIKD